MCYPNSLFFFGDYYLIWLFSYSILEICRMFCSVILQKSTSYFSSQELWIFLLWTEKFQNILRTLEPHQIFISKSSPNPLSTPFIFYSMSASSFSISNMLNTVTEHLKKLIFYLAQMVCDLKGNNLYISTKRIWESSKNQILKPGPNYFVGIITLFLNSGYQNNC